MKKAMATIGVIFFVLGLGLSWAGVRLGGSYQATVRLFGHTWEVYAPVAGRYDRIGAVHESNPIPSPGYRLESADSSSSFSATDPFSLVAVDIDVGNVTVAAGDSFEVYVNCWGENYHISSCNDGDTLQIWSESYGPVMNCGADIVIYVPAGTALADVTVLDNLGSVTLAGLTAYNVYVDVDMGEVLGEGLTVYGNIGVYGDQGDVRLYGDLESVEVDTDWGDVVLGLARPASDYCWDLSTDLGSVTVDGRRLGGNMSSYVADGNGDNIIYVDTDLGSITVDFDVMEAVQQVTIVDSGSYAWEELETGVVWDSTGTLFGKVPDVPSVPAAPEPPSAPEAPAAPAPGGPQTGG